MWSLSLTSVEEFHQRHPPTASIQIALISQTRRMRVFMFARTLNTNIQIKLIRPTSAKERRPHTFKHISHTSRFAEDYDIDVEPRAPGAKWTI